MRRRRAALVLAGALLVAGSAAAEPPSTQRPVTGDVGRDRLIEALLSELRTDPTDRSDPTDSSDRSDVVYEPVTDAELHELIEAMRQLTPLPRRERP